ncbi:hypothetical protein [Streptomyces gobitricini]|uniref:Uncharacterized protein n=1 Tax=Streptomyces gobitricini TaxID=68211 RepID=A0ABP5ZMI5_9ACTN
MTTGPAGSLLRGWQGLVEEVEAGYAWCAPASVHDRRCRGELARVVPRLTEEEAAAALRPRPHALDERFRAATIPWPRPGRGTADGPWWRHRVPRILEADPGERYRDGRPLGWDMLPHPKPGSVPVR